MSSAPSSLQQITAAESLTNTVENFVTIQPWAHLPWLRAAFSTRGAGVSCIYGVGVQNLGWTREDDSRYVAENRRRFLQEVAGDPNQALITLKQVHSNTMHDVTLVQSTGAAEANIVIEGDGLISATTGQLLGILTADCVPVLVADTRTRVVAAFHAGWRGTLTRIVEKGLHFLCDRHGAQPEDLVAAIGPAIRPCCFEVGLEVQHAFTESSPYAGNLFSIPEPGSKPKMNLQEANRQQLLAAGLQAKQIQTIAECTSCCRTAGGERKYFSYRAEAGVTGRMLSVIGVTATS